VRKSRKINGKGGIIKKNKRRMDMHICNVCGWVYDESKGLPAYGISPGTKWEDLPEDFVCPLCTAEKEVFMSV
jgi:rubredoxin-NAD+ reductase